MSRMGDKSRDGTQIMNTEALLPSLQLIRGIGSGLGLRVT